MSRSVLNSVNKRINMKKKIFGIHECMVLAKPSPLNVFCHCPNKARVIADVLVDVLC